MDLRGQETASGDGEASPKSALKPGNSEQSDAPVAQRRDDANEQKREKKEKQRTTTTTRSGRLNGSGKTRPNEPEQGREMAEWMPTKVIGVAMPPG